MRLHRDICWPLMQHLNVTWIIKSHKITFSFSCKLSHFNVYIPGSSCLVIESKTAFKSLYELIEKNKMLAPYSHCAVEKRQGMLGNLCDVQTMWVRYNVLDNLFTVYTFILFLWDISKYFVRKISKWGQLFI